MECRSKLVALMEFVYKPNFPTFTMLLSLSWELFSAFFECFALCVSMKVLKNLY